MSDDKNKVVEEISKFLFELMIFSTPPNIPEYYENIEAFRKLYINLNLLRDFLYATSNGDLSKKIPFEGYTAGTLKALQANFKHMTWQTKMISSGDFTQRIEFMGEFSQSFNSMVRQLEMTLRELVNKKTELIEANENLQKEIAIRKKAELALQNSKDELKMQVITDSLTGLYNRSYFNNIIKDEIIVASEKLYPLSVIMFDIDLFKHINDSFGHIIGDKVINKVAVITKENIRDNDTAARYGGEEFIILLPKISAEKAVIIAERIRREIEITNIETGKLTISVTASFGICEYNKKMDENNQEIVISKFIDNADQALYISKKSGRNKVTVFNFE
ncbi:MAG: diguanylate cyclase [Clostridiales bacterium]